MRSRIGIPTSVLLVSSVIMLLACVAAAQAAGEYQGKPYQGKPQIIPGRIQAELYDTGGQGVAYNDTDPENNGSGKLNKGDSFVDTFRKDEGVDISYTKAGLDKTVAGEPEKPGELYLGWTAPGEWVKYTVDVQTAGDYRINAHLSSRTEVAEISVALHALSGGGVASTGTIVLPTTGHWHTWRVAENLGSVRLAKGLHVLTLSVLKEGNFNIDYLEFVPVSATAAAFVAIDPFEQARQMQRGVNIIGYDPIWKDFTQGRFKDRHFQRIHEGGFQTLRVNLQAFQHMDSYNRLSPSWIKTMDWVVDNALANHLNVILDEHDYEPCGKDAAYCRTRLLSFWEQVAARYKETPNNVIFEILNEPNQQLDPKAWDSLMKDCLAVIRRTNPRRNVIIGPAFWNSINELKSLDLPASDHNIIVTVHYYGPMKFTHQGVYWNKEAANLSGISWGTDAEKKQIDDDFAVAQKWSKEHNRPILLGEFGAYDKGPIDSRVLWTSHVARTAEKLGWAWTYWQFDSDFVVYNIDKDDWNEPIRKALIP